MRVVTWLERLTEDSNSWFNALRAEGEGDLVSAIVLYLNDAAECIRRGSLARAALSCSCAADCLLKTGDPNRARRFYREAGSIYRENFEGAINGSVREALWSLERAYECFLLADDSSRAQQVREIYKPLARRADPFAAQDQLQLPKPDAPPPSEMVNSGTEIRPGDLELRKAIQGFLRSRESAIKRNSSPSPRGGDGGEIDEEGIVNQLG